MPKIKVDGIDLHYLTVGHGPDVVMLHGFLGNLAVWHLHMVPALRREFRITTLDLPGHGYSEVRPTGYTTEELAHNLRETLDVLGIKRPLLVGHSFGADICLHFALMYPDRVDKIVAIEPGLAALVHQRKDHNWEGWTYWVEKLEEVGLQVPADKRTDLTYLLDLSLKTPKFFGPARGLPRNRGPLLNLLENTTLMKDYEEPGSLTLDAVRHIKTRTFLIYGDKSHFLKSFEFLRTALPNCVTALLPGGEHFGPLEQPEQLTEHIRLFCGGASQDRLDHAESFAGVGRPIAAVRGAAGS